MSFKRGCDPKDSMDIGIRKNAKKVSNIITYQNSVDNTKKLDGNAISPYLIHRFLKALQEKSLPKDPSLYPHRIDIIILETRTDDPLESLRASLSFPPMDHENKSGIAREIPISLNVYEWTGKIMKYEDAYYKMPTIEELKNSGYDYLIILQEEYANIKKKQAETVRNFLADYTASHELRERKLRSDIQSALVHPYFVEPQEKLKLESKNRRNFIKKLFGKIK